MWTLPQRKQISIDKFVTDDALRTGGEQKGGGVLTHERVHLSFERLAR